MQDLKDLSAMICSINHNNSTKIRLARDTRTTPIIDDFYFSDKEYLVFERAFTIGDKWTRVSLVISKRIPDIPVINSGLTMTDLKKSVGIVLLDSYFRYLKETSRLYPLMKELMTAGERINPETKGIAFEHPIRLGGQTYENQTGFGSEYHGRNQIIQGTLYGETTGFYIIGVLID